MTIVVSDTTPLNYLILIDERRGRNVALTLGLAPISTLNVLEEAAVVGLIEIDDALRKLELTNFSACMAPRFRTEAIEMSFLEAKDVAKVLLTLHESAEDYISHLAAHLAEALFFTDCRFHEAALEVLACIAFKQPITQAEIDLLFGDIDKRHLVRLAG